MRVPDILLEQVIRVYADVQNKRRDDSDGFDLELWTKLEELGLLAAMCPEADGGFDLGWSDLFDVIAHSAACGEPAPLGETLVANAQLCSAGLAPGEGPVFIGIPAIPSSSGPVSDMPSTARRLVAEGSALRLVHPETVAGGLASDTMPAGGGLFQAGALLRSIQIAGALQGALDISVRYAQERSQFGRPLSKFQAVQHMLAQLAGEAAATAAAARTACARFDAGDATLSIAVAKFRAGKAVEKGAMLAHQIHGAIGVTLEYPLARLSRNMWRWSEEFGDQKYWAISIGRTGLGMASAWDTVVAASDPVGVADHG